jgi:hypothetical protein
MLIACNNDSNKQQDDKKSQALADSLAKDSLLKAEKARVFFDSPGNIYVCKDKYGLEEKLVYTVKDDKSLATVLYFTSKKTNLVQMLITKNEQNYCEAQFPGDNKNTYKISAKKDSLSCLNPDGTVQLFLKTDKLIKIETIDCAQINGEFNFEGPYKVTLVGLDNKTREFPYFQENATFFDNKKVDLFTPPSFNASLKNKRVKVTYHLVNREYPIYMSDKTAKSDFIEIISIETLK